MMPPMISRFEWVTSPLHDFRQLRREMNRLFSNLDGSRFDFLSVNIWNNPDEVIVTAEIPGVEQKSLNVTIHGDMLTIEGERKPDDLKEDHVYHRKERSSGQFTRTLRLPFEVEPDTVKAGYARGVLKVKLPRKESSKPRKIEVLSK